MKNLLVTEAINPWSSSLPRYRVKNKSEEMAEASASVGLLMATVLVMEFLAYIE